MPITITLASSAKKEQICFLVFMTAWAAIKTLVTVHNVFRNVSLTMPFSLSSDQVMNSSRGSRPTSRFFFRPHRRNALPAHRSAHHSSADTNTRCTEVKLMLCEELLVSLDMIANDLRFK